MQSECGKIRPRKTPNTDSLHAVCLFERFTGLMTAVHDIIIFFIPHHFSEKKKLVSMSARPQSWKNYIKYDQETVASKCMNKLI